MHLPPEDLETVKTVLKTVIPQHEVWAFGSRVHGRHLKPFSDLDLVVITKIPLDFSVHGTLKEAFSDSDLPFKVDVVDWARTDENFRIIITQHHEVIQAGSLS